MPIRLTKEQGEKEIARLRALCKKLHDRLGDYLIFENDRWSHTTAKEIVGVVEAIIAEKKWHKIVSHKKEAGP